MATLAGLQGLRAVVLQAAGKREREDEQGRLEVSSGLRGFREGQARGAALNASAVHHRLILATPPRHPLSLYHMRNLSPTVLWPCRAALLLQALRSMLPAACAASTDDDFWLEQGNTFSLEDLDDLWAEL